MLKQHNDLASDETLEQNHNRTSYTSHLNQHNQNMKHLSNYKSLVNCFQSQPHPLCRSYRRSHSLKSLAFHLSTFLRHIVVLFIKFSQGPAPRESGSADVEGADVAGADGGGDVVGDGEAGGEPAPEGYPHQPRHPQSRTPWHRHGDPRLSSFFGAGDRRAERSVLSARTSGEAQVKKPNFALCTLRHNHESELDKLNNSYGIPTCIRA